MLKNVGIVIVSSVSWITEKAYVSNIFKKMNAMVCQNSRKSRGNKQKVLNSKKNSDTLVSNVKIRTNFKTIPWRVLDTLCLQDQFLCSLGENQASLLDLPTLSKV